VCVKQPSKFFFALARGIFPVQELCGAFTALNLVRRDILGERMAWWRLLGPAVVLHSMANFRVRPSRLALRSCNALPHRCAASLLCVCVCVRRA
jgi:hypothetical protein